MMTLVAILQEVKDFFTAPLLVSLSIQQNFHATLYCHIESSTLILAFRGSASLTPTPNLNQIYDWYNTNFLQHLGDRPLQYLLAEMAADQVEKVWVLGAFDGMCGSERHPKLLLTGHSKGGGQAQYAAVNYNLAALVFNSDMLNPTIFADWMQAREDNSWSSFLRNLFIDPILRRAESIMGCARSNPRLGKFHAYLRTGKIRDIRMTNDPLTGMLSKLSTVCANNLPHAQIEWLRNTSSCSAKGHAIETVIRELQACR